VRRRCKQSVSRNNRRQTGYRRCVCASVCVCVCVCVCSRASEGSSRPVAFVCTSGRCVCVCVCVFQSIRGLLQTCCFCVHCWVLDVCVCICVCVFKTLCVYLFVI